MNFPFELEPKIAAWLRQVSQAGCAVGRVDPISVLRKKDGELLFALLDAAVRSSEGRLLPRYVFIRGDACVIVPLIRNRSTGEEKFLMVRQRRIGNGNLSLEFPAGMLDAEVDNPLGVATREFIEETGLGISASDLFPLFDKKLFSSVGASDEGIFYFGCVLEVDDTIWHTLGTEIKGNSEEGEHIAVTLISQEAAEAEATSLQVVLGFYLFEAAKKKVVS